MARPELLPFAESVSWVADEHDAMAIASGLVIATRPADQMGWLTQAMRQPHIDRLILEKPLAPTPAAAATTLQQLLDSGKRFAVAYTFPRTGWGERLLQDLRHESTAEKYSIQWGFAAHHYRRDLSNWKRFHDTGGGALRFYGIHIIALLADAGYDSVIRSATVAERFGEARTWVAQFAGSNRPAVEVSVDTFAASTYFQIVAASRGTATTLVDLADPFDGTGEATGPGELDRRIAGLADLHAALAAPPASGWYVATNHLWQQVEQQNVHSGPDASTLESAGDT